MAIVVVEGRVEDIVVSELVVVAETALDGDVVLKREVLDVGMYPVPEVAVVLL